MIQGIERIPISQSLDTPLLAGINKREFLENSLVFRNSFRLGVVYWHEFFLLKCIELASLFHLRLE